MAQADQLKQKSSGENFFYTFPEEAGDEWAFAVPECSQGFDRIDQKVHLTDRAGRDHCF